MALSCRADITLACYAHLRTHVLAVQDGSWDVISDGAPLCNIMQVILTLLC
jgi:hypothetical protein